MYISRRLHITTLFLAAIILSTAFSYKTYAQANVETYGKNRIQHRIFKWKYFDTKHFRIYHYDRSGRELARYVAEQVENDIAVIENKIGGSFSGRFNIILYNSYDEYQQTNVGRKNDGQLQDIPAGTVDIVGDKMVVYYTGKHTDLRRQTRAGMARIVMEKMLFGETLGEVVRNAILVNLPAWTVNGFIAYIVDGWDAETNSEWRSMVEAYKGKSFYELAEVEPELAGKAFWKFVSDNYGDVTMKNMVYTMQLKGNFNQAVKMNMGMKVKTAYDTVMTFYNEVYASDDEGRQQPDTANALIEIEIPKDGSVIRDVKVSPKGLDVAYVKWKNGEYEVVLQHTKTTQVKSSILTGGRFDLTGEPDPNYPILCWSNTGYKLAILYKYENETRLRIYNSIKAVIENYTIPENRFDRVLSMTFMEEDDKMIFAAVKNSQTDLYQFTIRGKRMINITDDEWDDLDPWYVSGGDRKGILFVSNRPKPNINVPIGVNELPTGPMNVYFYNTQTGSTELLQMTHYDKGDVKKPIQYGVKNFAYLYNEQGVYNQYVISLHNDSKDMDSATAIPITNYSRNIIAQQYNPIGNQVAEVMKVGNKYKVYYKPLQIPGKNAEAKTLTPTLLRKTEDSKKRTIQMNSDGTVSTKDKEEEPVLKRGNAFQSDFENEGNNPKTRRQEKRAERQESETVLSFEEELDDTATQQMVDSSYLTMRAYPYKLRFKPDQFTIRVDNSVLFQRYQPATLNNSTFASPTLGGMLTISLNDLMEDYRFTGGVRLPFNFTGLSYFVEFQNHKRRIDWNFLYLRQERSRTDIVGYVDTINNVGFQNEQLAKTVMNYFQVTASYPFNKFESLKLHVALRKDALNYKAQDTFSLAFPAPDNKQFWMVSKLEYVFDNSANPTINIYEGFRYKFYGEYMYKMDSPTGGFFNLGTDFRYYKKIYKHITWAVRAAGAHSTGKQKVLYFLGGVDNELNAKYNNNTPVRAGEQYGFQALSTNLRGYERNSYNGNTYAMINTEFRVPIVTSIVKRPIQSPILRNLQLVPFCDIASAWYGFWPTDVNVANDYYYPTGNTIGSLNTNVLVKIEDEKNLFAVGYGVGLRTMLFGYFIRGDVAWNIENHIKKPLLHFSIGTDF